MDKFIVFKQGKSTLEKCVRARAVSEVSEEPLRLIDRVVKKVKINMSLDEAEDLIRTIHRQ